MNFPQDARRRAVRERRVLAAVACCGALLLTAACGNRLPESEILAKNASGGTVTQLQNGVTDASTGGDVGGTSTGTVAAGGTGKSGSGTTTGAGGSGGTGGTTSAGSSGGGTTTGAVGGPKQNTQPITIGFIGALSGAGGVFVAPLRDAMLAWAKMVNASGGINGHPVKVLVGDDGINDARGLAIARDFVENQGAVALSWSSNDISGIANYAKTKHVPVIGAQTSQDIWFQNPYMFPNSAGASASGWVSAKAAKLAGVSKLAIIYCQEAPASCKTAADAVAAQGPSVGVQVVYEAAASIAAPDYMAECLQARNSGAEGILVLMDQHSLLRLAQSCHKVSYTPILIGPGGDALASEPDMDGMVTQLTTFPWFARSGSPGVAEYAAAIHKYAPDLETNGGSAQTSGWVAAKMFQFAAAQVPATAKPTTDQILSGLWGFKAQTLLGLDPGGMALTFTKLQPAPNHACFFLAKLQGGKWAALDNGAPQCR